MPGFRISYESSNMPSAVDFFTGKCADGSPSDDLTDAALFGICDDAPEKGVPRRRAYLDHADSGKWLARVVNAPQHKVVFKGVDNCITILKGNNKLQSRCDGILFYDQFTLFIELKSAADDSTKWQLESQGQVKQTIENYKENYPDDTTIREAYLVNAKRPNFPDGRQAFIDRFLKDTGVILHIEATIELQEAL